jgi:Sec-independent protein translocase protein TatA
VRQRKKLRKYLLGELTERERSQLADKYFRDENLFDELLDVESELLDQYSRRQLTVEQTRNFRQYLTSLPDGSTKLATAYALKEARNQISDVSPHSRWQFLPASLLNRRPLLQYVSVVIVVALLCGLAYLLIARRSLQREVEQLRTERSHAEQEKTQSEEQVRAAQESEAALQDRNVQLQQELSQLRQSDGRTRGGSETVLLVLSPALRSGSTPDSVTISDRTKTVLLVMPVSKDQQLPDYSVVLKTTRGQVVLAQRRLKPRVSDQGSTVHFRVSAALLTADTYKLTLHGQGTETAQDFYFKIVRRG